MSNISIRRCPNNESIISQANEIRSRLFADLGQSARIEDGVEGEFSLLVDGVPMLQRSDTYPPSIEEVEAALQNTTSSGDGPSRDDAWLSRPGGDS